MPGLSGGQFYNDAVVLGNTTVNGSTLTSNATGLGSIYFYSTIDAAGAGIQYLTVSAADNAIFGNNSDSGSIGFDNALSEFVVSANGNIQLNSATVDTTNAGGGSGDQFYDNAVVLGNTTVNGSTLTSTGDGVIIFNSIIDAAGTGTQYLSVSAADSVIFGDNSNTGSIGFIRALAFLGVDANTNGLGGNIQLNSATVDTNSLTFGASTGHQFYGEEVVLGNTTIGGSVLTSNATGTGRIEFWSTIDAHGIGEQYLVVSAAHNAIFGGNIGATTDLGALTVAANTGTITFGALASTVRAVNVNLNTNTLLVTPATVATIVASSNITFSNTTFAMGQNEKLTSLGGIRINGLASLTSNATSVTLGDVNAVGNLRVTSSSITLLARAAGSIRTNTGGSINDPMVDYVVGGQVFFSTTPVMGGSGTQATFSNPTGNVDGSGTLGNFAKTVYLTPITAALLTGQAGSGITGQILDLSSASGVPYTNPATLVPAPTPILPGIGLLGDSDTLDEAKDKEKAKAAEEGSTKKTASESNPEPAGIPVASR